MLTLRRWFGLSLFFVCTIWLGIACAQEVAAVAASDEPSFLAKLTKALIPTIATGLPLLLKYVTPRLAAFVSGWPVPAKFAFHTFLTVLASVGAAAGITNYTGVDIVIDPQVTGAAGVASGIIGTAASETPPATVVAAQKADADAKTG